MTAGTDTADVRTVVLPAVGATLRHAAPTVVEATVVPVLLFYGALWLGGVWWALGVALAWSYAAVGRRLARGGRVPGVLLLGTLGMTVRTVIAVLSGSVFVYFLQPTLGTVAVAGTFLASVPAGRPMIQRLVQDFLPLPAGFCDDRRVRPLFVRLTLAWAGVHLANAALTVWLLLSQPIEVFLLARTVAAGVLTLAAVAGSTLWFLAAARRAGVHVVFRRTAGTDLGTLPLPAGVRPALVAA